MDSATSIFAIARKPEDQITDLVRRGVHASSLGAVAAAMNLSSAVLATKLGITLRTVDRAKVARRRLDRDMSEKIIRLARVYNIASKVFTDQDSISKWLQTPSQALKGDSPLDLLDTDSGCRQVEQLLFGIAYGHFL